MSSRPKACSLLMSIAGFARLVANDGVLRALNGRNRWSPAYCHQNVPSLQHARFLLCSKLCVCVCVFFWKSNQPAQHAA